MEVTKREWQIIEDGGPFAVEAVEGIVKRLTLIWTTTKPTAPGWYWFKGKLPAFRREYLLPVILEVCRKGDTLVAWQSHCAFTDPIEHHIGEWAGPLEAP